MISEILVASRVEELGAMFCGRLYGEPATRDLDLPILQALRAAVPTHTLEALDRYIADHRPTGHFLAAVLVNDLREACARADPDNQVALHAIVTYLNNAAPVACWGDSTTVAGWLAYGQSVRAVEMAART